MEVELTVDGLTIVADLMEITLIVDDVTVVGLLPGCEYDPSDRCGTCNVKGTYHHSLKLHDFRHFHHGGCRNNEGRAAQAKLDAEERV